VEARERAQVAREEEGDGAAEREVERDYEREGEVEDAGGEGEEREQDDGADDDSFTMDMMLKTLNIDLEVIGYDKTGQRWIG